MAANRKQLTSLDLSSNQIGSENVEALCDALQQSTYIRSVDLRNNKIGSDGAKVLAIFLRKNEVITSVSFHFSSLALFALINVSLVLFPLQR